jgi:chromate transport protein ChrA
MDRSQVGMLVGAALGFAGWFGGFGAFAVVALCGTAGWVTGHVLGDGDARQRLRERLREWLDRTSGSGRRPR